MSQIDESEVDYFKTAFKRYKDKRFANDTKIIDFDRFEEFGDQIRKVDLNIDKSIDNPIKHDLSNVEDWQVFTLNEGLEGLFVIPKVLTETASKKWFNYLLNDLPIVCSNELKANISLPPTTPIENSSLSWITFGYNYDWDRKIYDKNMRSVIPLMIDHFAQYVSLSLGFKQFKTEAGIINYYRHNSTLCPHSDHSEPNKSAPLFSLSLGCSAIFLIGGTTRSSQPIIPMYLRDSDLLIMSSDSRQAYHAVPNVFGGTHEHNSIRRININIRQVY